MDDEFDDILLDDYNIDTLDRSQPNVPRSDDDNDESQATTTAKKRLKKKFDADLLLEPKGIHLLKNETQYIKFKKTRGHEHEDLKKLMTYYTIWANNLYPGLLFQDFARRVVNPAKSKSVRLVMEQWSDEYRQRRQVRLDVRNELSGKTVGDEDGRDGNEPSGRAAQDDDDDSSEDDNRPLFFPVSSTNRATAVANNSQQKKTAKQKGKAKAKAKSTMVKPNTKTFIGTDGEEDDDDDDEQPLFTSSQKQQQSDKRNIILDDSSDEEDTYNMSRSSALALIIERKRKREQAQREEQERAARPKKPSTSRSIIEDYDNEDKHNENEHQDKHDEQVQLALSDNELAALGIPTQKKNETFSAQEDPVEEKEIALALTEAELLALGLPPANKPDDDIQLALSDNELATSTTTTANSTQPHLEQESFSDNELFDIQEA